MVEVVTDDIVTRLRAGIPAECWSCCEWGCADENGNPVTFMEMVDDKCACDCHSWFGKVSEAANEIERLRAELVDWKKVASYEHAGYCSCCGSDENHLLHTLENYVREK